MGGTAIGYLVEHLMTSSLPMILGIVILILTLRRWITRPDK